MSQSVSVRWYGERGIVNTLVGCIQRKSSPLDAVRHLLSAVHWADGSRKAWIDGIADASVFVEWGFADFGNPDVVIVTSVSDGVRAIFIEAKIVPYLLSMRPNGNGIDEPGFNSSVNGQLALKYRFAKALEHATGESTAIEEPSEIFFQYRNRLRDPLSTPRRLAKPGIITRMLLEHGLVGIPEDRWSYVALTWDATERAFFRDEQVKKLDGFETNSAAVRDGDRGVVKRVSHSFRRGSRLAGTFRLPDFR